MQLSKELLSSSDSQFYLPSSGPFQPWIGQLIDLPSYVVPADVPGPIPDQFLNEFAVRPEQTLSEFLDANTIFANPRDIARILFHTPEISPFAVSMILFNSRFSSKALLFSFVAAIDLDSISLPDAMRFVTQKVALPTKVRRIVKFAQVFATAYTLRNELEWPDKRVVNDIFLAAIAFLVLGGPFATHTNKFENLRKFSTFILDKIGMELKIHPPALFFTMIPSSLPPTELISAVEQGRRFFRSWKTYQYIFEPGSIICSDIKDKDKIIAIIPTEGVIARWKSGSTKKGLYLVLQRFDNRDFGSKMKDGVLKNRSKNCYTLAFKSERELLIWAAAVNIGWFRDELKGLNQSRKKKTDVF
jgi:hypothetical protein